MTTLRDLDEIYAKYGDLRKHLISPTKDFLQEIVEWKRKFHRKIVVSKIISPDVKCLLLGKEKGDSPQ